MINDLRLAVMQFNKLPTCLPTVFGVQGSTGKEKSIIHFFIDCVFSPSSGYIAPWSGRFYSLWDTG